MFKNWARKGLITAMVCNIFLFSTALIHALSVILKMDIFNILGGVALPLILSMCIIVYFTRDKVRSYFIIPIKPANSVWK